MVCDILQRHLQPDVNVWVFGSRVKWAATDASDLDLAVEGDDKIKYETIDALENAFDESDLPYKVDVIDLKTVNKKFKEIVNQQKILLPLTNSDGHWNELRLENFAPFVYGKSLPTSQRNSSGSIPVVGSGGIIGYHDVGLTNKPTIVIGRKGTVGSVHYFSGPCWPIDTTFYVTGNDPLLTRFKYYLLKTLGLERMNSDSAVPGLNRDAAHARSLRIPNEHEQKTIAYILGSLDDKIELNRCMNLTLEEIERALFKSWFVDFEPVRAKMDGRWRAGESLPGLPAHLYDLFPDYLVDSELGEISQGWEVKLLGDITEVVGGATPSTKIPEYWDGGIHCWVTPKDLSNLSSPVLLNTERKITDAGLQQIRSGLLSPGTVLMSSRAPIGYLAITEIPVAINQELIAMLPRTEISRHFLHRWCEMFHNKIINYANGSTFLEINKSNFRKIPIVTPDAYVMSAYHKLVSTLHSKIVVNERSSYNLITQRDTMLPRLMSGKMRILRPNYKNDI